MPVIPRLALLVTGGALTWLVVAFSFDPLFITGSTAPVMIWGPDVSKEVVVAGFALLFAAAWRSGRTRLILIVVWFLFLATATHRLVEFSDGRVRDVWLAMTVQRLELNSEHLGEGTRCRVDDWFARCTDTVGNILHSASALPFVPLYPGRWTEAGPFPGPR